MPKWWQVTGGITQGPYCDQYCLMSLLKTWIKGWSIILACLLAVTNWRGWLIYSGPAAGKWTVRWIKTAELMSSGCCDQWHEVQPLLHLHLNMGPILFSIFFSDLGNGQHASSPSLHKWADGNFNRWDCPVLHLERNNLRLQHRLVPDWLEENLVGKDLRVLTDTKLNVSGLFYQDCSQQIQERFFIQHLSDHTWSTGQFSGLQYKNDIDILGRV